MTALLPVAVDQAPPPLLTVPGLEASFGPARALNGVDLAVQPGELIALAGENGAGKTTLVRCIAGDITPASGEIYLAGRKVAADPVAAARQGIAVSYNGLLLLGLGPAAQDTWTAAVLLAAVTVDTLARRGRTAR